MQSRQSTELAIGVLFRLCSGLLGRHWHPSSTYFTHKAPPDLQVHRRVFRCQVNFEAEFNGITCPAGDLDYPNPIGDPSLAQFAERFVESLPEKAEHSVVLDSRKAIYLLLPMGRATVDEVAQTMGMNVRTLQRRLDDSDTAFTDLVNNVRRELVVRYMGNSRYTLSQVAQLLGYSAPSSFTRWFTNQFGCSPAKWRAEHVS